MNIVAILFDVPPPHYPVTLSTLYLPLIVIIVTWLLLRWKKSFVPLALGLAAISAFIVCFPLVADLLDRSDLFVEWTNLAAMAFSAAIPFVAIARFYYSKPKRTSGPSRAVVH